VGRETHTLPRKLEAVHKKTTNSKRMSPNVCRATPPIIEPGRLDPDSTALDCVVGAKEDDETRSSRSSGDARPKGLKTTSGSRGDIGERIMLRDHGPRRHVRTKKDGGAGIISGRWMDVAVVVRANAGCQRARRQFHVSNCLGLDRQVGKEIAVITAVAGERMACNEMQVATGFLNNV
jgi:hypothetical protein